MEKIELYGLKISEEITSSINISEFIVREAEKQGYGIEEKDVIVITSKIVSKAEGRIYKLNDITHLEKLFACPKFMVKVQERWN